MSRIFIGGLTEDASRSELEREFEYFGRLRDVWVARNPPGFGFIVYDEPRDAEDAVNEMDGKRVCGTRIRVEFARGPVRGGRGGSSRGKGEKCYSCGRFGHSTRECRSRGSGGGARRRSRSRSRSHERKRPRRSRSKSRSRSRERSRKDRSRSKDRKRSRERRSHSRDDRSRSKDKKSVSRSRSRSGSKERKSRERKSRSHSHSRSKSRSRSRSHSADANHHDGDDRPDEMDTGNNRGDDQDRDSGDEH